MLRILILFLFAGWYAHVSAQLTLEECHRLAQANYPLVRQYKLIELSKEYNLSNAAKGNLPQISLSGKISYQSDVTSIPFDIPDVSFEGLRKDQYTIMAEVQQNIWDGGQIRYRKRQAEASSEEAERELDVSMYALNEQVNEVFFGILLLDEQLHQNTLLDDDLNRNLKNITAYRNNGIANDADIDAVQVEILNTRQQRIALESERKAYLQMLSLLIGKKVSGETVLCCPELPEYPAPEEINRPELSLYAAQTHSLDVKEQSLKAGYLPRFSLFAQGAYGNPGLDMLKNEFTPYYIIGARMSWNFGSLYTLKNDRRKLKTQRLQIESNRDLFLFNTRLQLARQEETLSSLGKQMKTDKEIIRLRTNIRQAAEAKVANGTLTVNEMLRELTRESMARQDEALHRIQLIMETYQQKHLTNR